MSNVPSAAVPPEYAHALTRLAPRPVAQLYTLPPRDWLVPDVFPAGELAVIGGPSKSFKTSIAIDLAVSLATGTRFLNAFPVTGARSVWVISGEVGQHALKDQVGRVAAARRLAPAALGHLAWATAVPALHQMADVAAVAEYVRCCAIEVVILDPLYLALAGVAGQATNLLAVGPLIHNFAAACRDAGATPILVHHTIKKPTKTARYAELADLTQAGVGEVARTWLLIHRLAPPKADPDDEAGDPPEDEPGVYAFTMNIGGSAGHSSRWRLDVDVRGGRWEVRVGPGGGPAPARPTRDTGRPRRMGMGDPIYGNM